MDRQPLTYDFPILKTPSTAFNGIGIIRVGGGNSLIINELEQKPSDFTENLLKEYSGGTKALNAFNDIKAFSAAAFMFSRKLQPNNKSLTNLKLTIFTMKKTTKLKVFALSVAMAFGMLLPNAAFAQSDDFFRSEDNFNGNRIAADGAIINNGIGQSEAPLGSGLLILSAVGAGYAVARRKRHNGIKAIIIITALIGVTSCRKNLDTVNEAAQHGVYITLNVDGGEKVAVDPTGGGTYATVTWEDGDILYVGNNGVYCGYLTYDKSTSKFGGDINPTSAPDGDYLHFYFMGNKGTTSEPTSVNITDQTSKYPVISYGRSTSLYNSGTTEYSATLYNKCAIGKFTISGVDTDNAITITGMNNTVAVDFSKNGKGAVVNPYTYSKTGSGEIRLHAESNTVRWAILLPQDEVTTATAYASGYTSTSAFTVPAVSANGYYDSGVAVAMASGSPKGAFTINDSGDQVFFAPGNLQYTKSTNTWSFMEHQWSTVETLSQNVGTDYADQDVVSLFGWGTSGYNHGATCYQPYNTSNSYSKYYAYGKDTYNLYDQTGQADWGYAANAANLGGYSTWRTLKDGTATGTNEWQYIFNSRKTGVTVNGTANARYTEATINTNGTGVNGIILFPDSYSGPTTNVDGITFGTINGGSSWGTKCTTDGWATLESAGCVFLPAAGYRDGTSVNNAGSNGRYWSSSYRNSIGAYHVVFDSGNVNPQDYINRFIGCSVRLARDV